VAPPKGFEPLTDWLTARASTVSSELPFTITDNVLERFSMFCRIDLLRSKKSIKMHINALKRYIRMMGSAIDAVKIRDFLSRIRTQYPNPRTYRWYLCALKVFCRDFLNKGEWVATLKFPKIKVNLITDLPTRQQLTQFFSALPNDKAKTIFLLYCSSGLRKSEIRYAKIIPDKRCIIPTSHEQQSTKNSYVSFYNAETERYLKKVNFDVNASEISIRRWFKSANIKTQMHLKPQMLRQWFCVEMAMLNVPDRYVDAYCGRIPKSVLSQRYTNYGIETLRAIYDKANLTVLQQQPIAMVQ
jgi:integrase